MPNPSYIFNPPSGDVGVKTCDNCLELRPCPCGEFCPVCMGDLRKFVTNDAVICKDCGLSLRKKQK